MSLSSVHIGSQVNPQPRVSIIIPAYNIAEFIAEALESVFAQTYQDFEVVLVNDGSPDTAAFERAIEPFRARLVYLVQQNGGAAAARNAAIGVARGELLAFLDGDDLWLPNFLESQIGFLDRNGFDMVYADAELYSQENAGEFQTYMQFSVSRGAVTTESLLAWECNVITSGTVLRKAQLLSVGLFDESELWRRAQDFEMWFRLAKAGARIGYQTRVLLKYRIWTGSLSGDEVKHAERNIHSLEGIREKYVLTASEQAIWERMMLLSQAMFHVESGKAALVKGDYRDARENFVAANRFYRKPKLALVNFALRLAPGALRFLFLRYESNSPHRRWNHA